MNIYLKNRGDKNRQRYAEPTYRVVKKCSKTCFKRVHRCKTLPEPSPLAGCSTGDKQSN